MDLRSEFVANLTSLPHQEGASIAWEREVGAPADMGVEMLGVPQGETMNVALRLHSVSEGVYVDGLVRTKAVGRCARCLVDIEHDIDEKVAELVFYPQKRQALIDEGDEEAEEFSVLEGDHLDLEPILRDAVVLSLPFTPLCKADCEGMCSGCGQRWEELPDDHFHETETSDDDPLALLEAQLRAEGAQ